MTQPPFAPPPPPFAPPPSAPRGGNRLPLIIGAVVVLLCIGALCVVGIAVFAFSRLAPSVAPTSTSPAFSLNPTATTRAILVTSVARPTLAVCPTQTPEPLNGPAGQPTTSGPQQLAQPAAVCVTVTPLPTRTPTVPPLPTIGILATRVPTTIVQAGRTPLPTVAFRGSCARPIAATLTPSPYITSIAIAKNVQGDNKDPVNPTRTFVPNAIFHAVVAIENAPSDSKFKAIWYATDVGSAAACNTLIDSFELTSQGSRNLDFNLTPNSKWLTGLYRVEIFVNSKLDSITDFTVQ